jgi:hypothetical protein
MTEQLQPPDYEHLLGISWPVDARFAPVDRPQIYVDVQNQLHHIRIPDAHRLTPFSYWRCDYVHELVHAKMAETVDPIFAATYFSKDYDETNPEVAQKMWLTSYAQQLVDIWVYDRMHQLEPALVEEDVVTWLNAVNHMNDQELGELQIETILGAALTSASIDRFGLGRYRQEYAKVLKTVRNLWGTEAARQVRTLSSLYSGLPPLPDNQDTALRLFEQSTKKAARILGFDINPHIVDDNGLNVWKFD